jgi:hypothetical protein
MAYLGLVPSESSTGDTVKRRGITKAGNSRARRILVEAAWSYQYPARVGRQKQPKVAAAPRRVREIAWKAQTRLCGRFRALLRKGKMPTIAVTAMLASYRPSFGRSIARSYKLVRRKIVRAVDRSSREARSTGPQPSVADPE